MALYKNSHKNKWLESTEKTKSIPLETYADEASGFFDQEISAHLDLYSLINLYMSEAWVYIVCNAVAKKISKQFLSVVHERLSKGSLVEEPAEAHSLVQVLDRPNDWESYTNFMYRAVTYLVLTGNVVIWKLKFHKQLIILPTELLMIEFDQNKNLMWYVLNGGQDEEYQHFFKGSMRIYPEDVIHVRLPNISSMLWGLSPFVPGRKSVLFDRYSTEYLLNFYLKQANPGAVIEMTKDANEKQ
ncbi:unnamed protein product, partial [marine sediment metagenome]